MRSEIADKLTAARERAKTGPKTLEGKRAVRMNGYRHGLTAQELIIQPHEEERYRHLTEGFRKRFRPADHLEEQMVQQLADDSWRLSFCAALESNIFNYKAGSHATCEQDPRIDAIACRVEAWIENAQNIERLGRHETRISNRFHRTMARLRDVQADRRARQKEQALENGEAETGHQDEAAAREEALPVPAAPRYLTQTAEFKRNLELLCKSVSQRSEARGIGAESPVATEATGPLRPETERDLGFVKPQS